MIKRRLPEINEGNYRESISEALKIDRDKFQKEQLKKYLSDYDLYQKVFSEAFTGKNPLGAVYSFRVTYQLKKPVWREVVIWGSQTFCDLAETIIKWMGWDNDHMHGFSMKKVNGKTQMRYTDFTMYAPGWEDDPHPTFKTDEVKIADVDYQKHPKWGFIFDFGDGHEFDIELIKIDTKVNPKDFDEPLPTCIDQRGVAPVQYPPCDEDEESECI